jgi:hypothetical protein
MPPFVIELLDLVETHPFASLIVAIGTVLYVRLMTSEPRAY